MRRLPTTQLLDKLKKHQVVVVTAPTGSGKSTQLPQYMLDHVLSPAETRQVAVLEPRRVNASALCQRVAEERGVLAGREVGYTVGRGEELASAETRIRFMTHGLFVQLAKDPLRFARKGAAAAASSSASEDSIGYAAVILDEAHERTAVSTLSALGACFLSYVAHDLVALVVGVCAQEIDMSLALIKRLVANTDVRVIVTSATIGSSKEVFRNFLRESPSKPLPELVELTGKTFPVHVQRRDISTMISAAAGGADVSLHDKTKQLGFAGVSKVLCQVALQQAVDLLSTSDDGNV
jgi:HrpA-like RNA helicase